MTFARALPKVLGIALLCLTIGVRADNNEAFEDCATTTFEMRNNKVYLGADVIKFVKLQVGQGSTDCMSLCRASEECWSYNYDKTRKFCYLSSDEGTSLKSKRRQTWNSGYRVCVAHSDNTEWNNFEIDAATLAPTWGDIDVQYDTASGGLTRKLSQTVDYPWTDGTITFSWEAAKGLADLNGAALPQYRIRCGPNNTDWHCDEAATEGWNSGYGLIDETSWSTSATEDFQALFALGVMKCYVEVYVDGIKTACSDAHTDIIDPFAALFEWQPDNQPSLYSMFTGMGSVRRKLLTALPDAISGKDNSIAVRIENDVSTRRKYYYVAGCTNNLTISDCYDFWDLVDSCDVEASPESCDVSFAVGDPSYTKYGYGSIDSSYPYAPPSTPYTYYRNFWWSPPSGVHRCWLGVVADFWSPAGSAFQPICEQGSGTLVSVSGNSSYIFWYDLGVTP